MLRHPMDYVAPSSWIVWTTTHYSQVHSVLQDVALVAAVFASIAAGLFHLTKWLRMIRDKQSED